MAYQEWQNLTDSSWYLVSLKLLFTDELQLRQERLSQVAILQHHPKAFLHSLINPALCHGALALPQADHLHPPPFLLRKLQQSCCWVTAHALSLAQMPKNKLALRRQ